MTYESADMREVFKRLGERWIHEHRYADSMCADFTKIYGGPSLPMLMPSVQIQPYYA